MRMGPQAATGDVVDVEVTAAETDCRVYLPVDRVIGAENNKAAGGIASYPNMHTWQYPPADTPTISPVV